MAVVELLLSPLPSHVRTARLVVLAAARRAGLEDSLVDELRLAVSEACSRAVGLNAQHAPDLPVRISIADDPARLTLTVTDAGPVAGRAAGELADLLTGRDAEEVADPDVALAVLTGLLDEVEVDSGADGTTVTMRWPLPVRAAAGATVLSQT